MTIKLGSNLASLNAQRRLGEASSVLGTTYERLSSGQRINRASDDAAGLAIADDLKSKSRIYTQAIRNANDGVSLLNIADSAIEALTSVVVRIRELSEQAANGTYSSTQRAALDAEAQALSKEFTRITQSTSFNGIKIFDGSLGSGVRLQLGIGTAESINASIGGAIGTGEFGSQLTFTTEDQFSWDVTLGDLNGDGILDLVTAGYGDSLNGLISVRLGQGDGSFGQRSVFTTPDSITKSVVLGDLNNDGILDLVSTGESYGGTKVAVRLGIGDGTFGSLASFSTRQTFSSAVTLGDVNADGILDIAVSGASPAGGQVSVFTGTGSGTFSAGSIYSADSAQSMSVALNDINNDGYLDLITAGSSAGLGGTVSFRLGQANGNFGSLTIMTAEGIGSEDLEVADLNNDGFLDLITSGASPSSATVSVRLGNGNGTFSAVTSYTTETNSSFEVDIGDLNGDGNLDLITAGYSGSPFSGSSTVLLGTGNGSFSLKANYSTEPTFSTAISLGDLNSDGVLDMVTAGGSDNPNPYDGYATIRLSATKEGLGALQRFSLKTRAEALLSMNILDQSLQNLAKQRGTIGASQSRVGIAVQNLQTSNEGIKTAESRIRDADIASEAAKLIRNQILQQAAASVLSQANQLPSLALRLLS